MESAMRAVKRWIANIFATQPILAALSFFICGLLFWGAFNWSLEITNTESFCISCHEMNENLYTEYKTTIHFENESGVRATCPDCHVPKNWLDKVIRKVGATNELWHKAMGSIDTREKFLNKRLILANHVWTGMRSSNSLECRNCHELAHMKKVGANKAHQRAEIENLTCIDCHMGIAHQLPESFIEAEHETYKNKNTNCGNCHASLEREVWDES